MNSARFALAVWIMVCVFPMATIALAADDTAPLSASDWQAQSSENNKVEPIGDVGAELRRLAQADQAEAASAESSPEPVSDTASPAPAGEAPTNGKGVLSVDEQLDPNRGALPGKSGGARLRLKLDTIELEQLNKAVQEESQRESVRVSLDDCVRMALERNQDIQIIQFTPMKSDMDILAAQGEFDPILGSNYTYAEVEQTNSAEIIRYGGLESVKSKHDGGQASLSGKLKWGTQYTLTLDMSRDKTTYNSFKPDWNGDLTLKVTQPLLRGYGKDYNLAQIRMAKNSRLQADDQVELQVMNTIAEVVRAYWDLVGSVEYIKVQQEALDNAERLLQINEERNRIGTGAALEVVQAKAGVATRQSDLISARSQARDAADRLKNVINMRDGEMLSRNMLDPVDRPSLSDIELDEDKSVALAIENRPDIRSAETAIDSAEIERKRSKNAMLPQVDLSGTLGQGGRGAEASKIWDGITERKDNSYSVGLQGSVPLGNKTGRGQYQRAVFDKREMQARLEKAKQDAMLNVRMALRNVGTSRILVESNKQARRLQETNVAAEEKRLRLGVTTSFELLRIQSDLTAAQTQELQSTISYEKAIVDLRLAEGVLLKELGIQYDLPDTGAPPTFWNSINPNMKDE